MAARLNQRAAQRFEEHAIGLATRAMLGDLTGSARHNALVTLGATLAVECRTQTIGDVFHLLEDEAVVVEGAKRLYVGAIQAGIICSLHVKAIALVIEAAECFGGQ